MRLKSKMRVLHVNDIDKEQNSNPDSKPDFQFLLNGFNHKIYIADFRTNKKLQIAPNI